jgi:hypothetical protein
MGIITTIKEKDYNKASSIIKEQLVNIAKMKLTEKRKMLAAKLSEGLPVSFGLMKMVSSSPKKHKKDSVVNRIISKLTGDVKLEPVKPLPPYDSSKDTGGLDKKGWGISKPIDEMDDSNLPVSKNIEDRRTLGDLLGVHDIAKDNDVSDHDHLANMSHNEPKASTIPLPRPKPTPLPRPKPTGINEEMEELDEARIKIIRARIRNGKVQRRKKVSNVVGYTFRGGKLKRMSASERRKRKLGAKRGRIKRRSKLNRTLQKRRRSLQKRARLGL